MPVDREALQDRLRALFVDELAENVGVLSRGLLALEQGIPTPADRSDVVNEVFRAAHSLKGGAHAAGVPEVAELCHHLEDVLSRLREGALAASAETVEPLLAAVDALSDSEVRLRGGGEVDPNRLRVAGRGLASRAVTDSLGVSSTPGAAPGGPPSGAREAREPPAQSVRRDGMGPRVPVERLDVLLNEAGEVLQACRRVDALAGELAEVAAAAGIHDGRNRSGSPSSAAGSEWRSMRGRLDDLSRGAADASRQLGLLGEALIQSVRHVRMIPLLHGLDGLERVVRDQAKAGGKEVHLALNGGQVEVDRPILEAVAEALLHLVRNAVDHGIERPEVREAHGKQREGQVTVDAQLGKDGVVVTVADDGRGLDLDALGVAADRRGVERPGDGAWLGEVAFAPGVSTARYVTQSSGRGVGLDAVRARIEAVGGSVRLDGADGAGCVVTVEVPLALSAVRVVLFGASEEVIALPSASVTRVLRIDPADLRQVGPCQTVLLDRTAVPMIWLAEVLGLGPSNSGEPTAILGALVGGAADEAVLVVDRVISEGEVVMKPLGEDLAVPGVLGATILDSGRVALVLNPVTCVRAGRSQASAHAPRPVSGDAAPRVTHRILLAEDTITTRALERSILEAAGYEVEVAVDGLDAWRRLEEHGADLVVSDVDMPRMSGIELCAAIRRSGRFPDLPVVLVTSLASDADRRRGVDAGASAYLVKSDFDQAILLDTIGRLL